MKVRFFDNENAIATGQYFIEKGGEFFQVDVVGETWGKIDSLPEDVEEKSEDCFSEVFFPDFSNDVRKIYSLEKIELYFSATPETITEEMRKKIEETDYHLEITLDHEKETASWCFVEGHSAGSSFEDDYDGVMEFLKE